MLQIQLAAVPNQTLSVTLAQQNAQLALRQNGNYMYFDLAVDGGPIVTQRICLDRQPLLEDVKYRGFVGDFKWYDIQGNQPPNYLGIGTRFYLMYIEATA